MKPVETSCLSTPTRSESLTRYWIAVVHCSVGRQPGEIRQEIREIDPALILAIGWDTLDRVVDNKNWPIVYAHAYSAEENLMGRENITGVSMRTPIAFQIGAIKTALPSTKTVGLFYSSRTMHLIREAKAAAEALHRSLR